MSNKTELEAFKVAMALTEGGGKIDYTQVNSLTGATGVALYWFNKNYNDFGSWELAAIAHFAGRSIAAKAAENGVESVYSLKDGTGVDIKTYVDKVLSYMAKEMPKAGKKVLQTMEQNTPIYQNPLTDKEVVTKEAANVLDVMTNAMSENSRSQFPMQVPSGIQDYDSAIYQTRMNRLKKGIGK
jgi:hypothetical protein